jgi:hypothetical protein
MDANPKSGSAQIPAALAFARSAFGVKRFSNREQNRSKRFVAYLDIGRDGDMPKGTVAPTWGRQNRRGDVC